MSKWEAQTMSDTAKTIAAEMRKLVEDELSGAAHSPWGDWAKVWIPRLLACGDSGECPCNHCPELADETCCLDPNIHGECEAYTVWTAARHGAPPQQDGECETCEAIQRGKTLRIEQTPWPSISKAILRYDPEKYHAAPMGADSRPGVPADTRTYVVHHKDHPPCLLHGETEARDAAAERGADYRMTMYVDFGAEAKAREVVHGAPPQQDAGKVWVSVLGPDDESARAGYTEADALGDAPVGSQRTYGPLPIYGAPKEETMKTKDLETFERMWERCPQCLGNGFPAAVVVPDEQWYCMKRYVRHLREELRQERAMVQRMRAER